MRARKGKFELIWEPDAETNPKSIKRDDITLTAALASDDCWSADLKVIAKLHREYSGFLEEIDIHLKNASFLLPETFALVRQHLGETMIASLRDTLYYRYGLNSGLAPNLTTPDSVVKSPYVDLLPGMRVRLEYAQLTSGDGYAATGSGSYTVTRHAPRSSSFIHTKRDRLHEVMTGFDGFLNIIAAPQEINRDQPAAGLLEINECTRLHRHVRLLYPTRDLP
ncbi:MAG: hypothetical protein K8I82_04960, partial [Anaerolineae bacterium]|nr:hypothetical protein [Anaerolineae bacterium]